MNVSGPPAALSQRDAIANWLDDGDGLLLGLDFDGTLAPIVCDPDAATITGRAKSLVAELTHIPEVTVAIISGRELDDLEARVDLDGPIYAGNHGLELADYDATRTHPVAQSYQSDIDAITRVLRARLEDVPGAMVEDKDLTATVHFRDATDPDAVAATVESAVSSVDADLEVTAGRAIREVRPSLDWGKDAAMHVFESLAPDGHRPMYLGDDVTDEDAFQAIQDGGVGIRIGTATGTETAADYQLSNQEQVPRFLEWITEYASERWGEPRTHSQNATETSTTPETDSPTTRSDATPLASQRLLEDWEGAWDRSATSD